MSKPSKSKGNAVSADEVEAVSPPLSDESSDVVEAMGLEPVAAEAPETKPEPVVAAKSAPARKANDLVVCRIHSGQYLAERVYNVGEEVLVPFGELDKLAHCLAPSEE